MLGVTPGRRAGQPASALTPEPEPALAPGAAPVPEPALAPVPPARRAATPGRGVAWEGLSYTLSKVLLLLASVGLAWIVTPQQFGLVALALLFITFAENTTDLGTAEALVYHEDTPERRDAALVISLLWSCLLALAAVCAAPAAARILDTPAVTGLVQLLALSLPLRGLCEVPDALLRKQMRFRERALPNLAQAAAQAVVSIGTALAGCGATSIVYGYLASQLSWAVVGWWLVDYRPGRRWWRLRWQAARPLLRFGVPTAGNALLTDMVFNVDYLIVALVLGPTPLAFYSIAFRFAQTGIVNILYTLAVRVGFPVFTAARTDRARLRELYCASVRMQTLYGVSTAALLAVGAPALIGGLLGERWHASVPVLQALAAFAACHAVAAAGSQLLKGMGLTVRIVVLELVRLALLVPVLVLACRGGITGVALAQVAVSLVFAVVVQVMVVRAIQLPARRLVARVAPAALPGVAIVVAGGAVAAFGGSLGTELAGMTTMPVALAALAVGTAAGLAVAALVEREGALGLARAGCAGRERLARPRYGTDELDGRVAGRARRRPARRPARRGAATR